MRGLVLRVEDGDTELGTQFGIRNGDGLVDGGVTRNVGRVVRESAKGEGVFVDVFAFAQELDDKVSAANVVDKVAEFTITKRIVAEVLDDGTAIGVGVRIFDLVVCETGITGKQERPDFVDPKQIDNLFMSQN